MVPRVGLGPCEQLCKLGVVPIVGLSAETQHTFR
jgi:hypothetical protein